MTNIAQAGKVLKAVGPVNERSSLVRRIAHYALWANVGEEIIAPEGSSQSFRVIQREGREYKITVERVK